MYRLVILTLLLTALNPVELHATDGSEPLIYSKIEVEIRDDSDLYQLLELGLLHERHTTTGMPTQLILNDVEIDLLRSTTISSKILIPDIQKHYETEILVSEKEMTELQARMDEKYNIGGFEFGSMGGYYTLEEIIAELDSMHLVYPTLITPRTSIGKTHEGRDIWMVTISDNPDQDEGEVEILYTALHHAREVQSMMTLLYYMNYLLENYDTDPLVRYLVDHRRMVFVPIVNPDGFAHNEFTNPEGGGMWRKNRRDNGDGSYGVDLNRNYGVAWGRDNTGSSPNPASNVYRGTEAFSEPETQAMRDLCLNRDFKLAFNWHSYWNWIFYPWEYNMVACPDSALFQSFLSHATVVNDYGYYPPHPSNIYLFNGSADDWMYGGSGLEKPIFTMTPEVGGNSDGFWPPASRIYPLAEENVHTNLMLALGPGIITTEQVHLELMNGEHLAYLEPGGDSADVTVSIPGIATSPGRVVLNLRDERRRDRPSYSSTELRDDGHTPDDLAADGAFSGRIPVPDQEATYQMDAMVEFDPSQASYSMNVGQFTTLGPLLYAGITEANAENPTPGQTYMFYFAIRNEGQNGTVPAVSAQVRSDHPHIQVESDLLNFGTLSPGQSRASYTGEFVILNLTDTSLDQSSLFDLSVEIFSQGQHFWSDTFSIELHPVSLDDEWGPLPAAFDLKPCYPNPFNPETQIEFSLPAAGRMDLSIFDLRGRHIRTIMQGEGGR